MKKYKCEICGNEVGLKDNIPCPYCRHRKRNGFADKMTEVKKSKKKTNKKK